MTQQKYKIFLKKQIIIKRILWKVLKITCLNCRDNKSYRLLLILNNDSFPLQNLTVQ